MTTQVATYKGRKYRVAFLGQTKFGRRAKLQFFDGSKEFWVAADLVQVSAAQPKGYAPGRNGRRYCCDECGEYHAEGDGTRCWETGMAH